MHLCVHNMDSIYVSKLLGLKIFSRYQVCFYLPICLIFSLKALQRLGGPGMRMWASGCVSPTISSESYPAD